jgi:hypothetical protein
MGLVSDDEAVGRWAASRPSVEAVEAWVTQHPECVRAMVEDVKDLLDAGESEDQRGILLGLLQFYEFRRTGVAEEDVALTVIMGQEFVEWAQRREVVRRHCARIMGGGVPKIKG